MPDPARVNEVRDELKQANFPSATAEERALREADGEEPGVPAPAIDENSPLAIAQRQGTRVWNHWDDATAAEIQKAAGERALSPEESEDVVGDPTKPARTTAIGVQPEGLTGPTGATGSTGATGTTGATGAGATGASEASRREAEQLEKAKSDRTEREKQTAKSGV